MNRTGLVYSMECLKHKPYDGILEVPERISATIEHFKTTSLLDKLHLITPAPAEETDLMRVHSREHIDYVKGLSERGYVDFDIINPDIYVGANTYNAALYAAGGVISAVKSTLGAETDNCFCLVRPPGHHASSYPSGYCYFNNTAVAIRYAQQEYGIRKVAVFDWDAHAGNGTMKIFYNDPSVLTISVHRDPHEFFPGDGFVEQIGEGEGKGYCMNLPVPAGTGDADYVRILDDYVLDAMRRFEPEALFVAAGQDSHLSDPLGELNVTVDGYVAMTQRLMALADEVFGGRIILALEGGYNIKTLPGIHQSIVETLLGLKGEVKIDGVAGKPTLDVLSELKRNLKGTPLALE